MACAVRRQPYAVVPERRGRSAGAQRLWSGVRDRRSVGARGDASAWISVVQIRAVDTDPGVAGRSVQSSQRQHAVPPGSAGRARADTDRSRSPHTWMSTLKLPELEEGRHDVDTRERRWKPLNARAESRVT